MSIGFSSALKLNELPLVGREIALSDIDIETVRQLRELSISFLQSVKIIITCGTHSMFGQPFRAVIVVFRLSRDDTLAVIVILFIVISVTID